MRRREFLSIAVTGVVSLFVPASSGLPSVPMLLDVASRCKGRRTVSELMADEVVFLAHVMTYGGAEDIAAAEKHYSADAFKRVLRIAPAKIFDPMSWHFWHRRLLNTHPPRMPYDWFAFHRKAGKSLITADEIEHLRYGC